MTTLNPNAICANCGRKYKEHYFENYGKEPRIYCFTNTNGDVFSNEPSDHKILDMILEDNPDLYDRYIERWQKENGHK